MTSLLDAAVFPGSQGGPLEHVIAGKAIAFKEASSPRFREYGEQVIKNASKMASLFINKGYDVISGGTDNHLMLIDLRPKFPDLTGRVAEDTLGSCHITINKNTVPGETRSPFVTSGMRIGLSAMTTRGLKENDMDFVVDTIDSALEHYRDKTMLSKLGAAVAENISAYPLFGW